MYAVIDSNILLHYKWFEDIPWAEELDCETVIIVLTSVVVGEIDKKKDQGEGKVQKRAKAVSSKLGSILLDGKDSKCQVKFLDLPFATEEEKRHYNLDRNDSQILFTVLKSDINNDEVCVVSSDNNMLLRAKSFGFKWIRLDEKYRLVEELTKVEKEAKAAVAELERMKKRLSDPVLLFNNGDNHIRIKRSVPMDIDTKVQEEMTALKAKWPEKRINDDQQYLYEQIFNMVTPEMVVAFNRSRSEFLERSEKKIRLEVQRDDLAERMAKIVVMVFNSGTAPTGRMNIFLKVPEDVAIYAKGAKKSITYDEPHTPNYHPQLNNISFGLPYFPKVEMWDLNAYAKDNKLSGEVEPLTHNLQHKTFEFYVDSATCPNFKMHWLIADAALADPVRGELNVSFVDADSEKQ